MTNAQALHLLHSIQSKLLGVVQQFDVLELKERNMPLDPTVVAVIGKIDDATNAIAARMQALIDKANAAGQLTAAEVVAALEPEVTKLQGLGADPNNPVPTA